MNYIYGTSVIASTHCVKAVQARTHRKKRVNKKWMKRYGKRWVPDDSAYLAEIPGVGKVLIAHPKTVERLMHLSNQP